MFFRFPLVSVYLLIVGLVGHLSGVTPGALPLGMLVVGALTAIASCMVAVVEWAKVGTIPAAAVRDASWIGEWLHRPLPKVAAGAHADWWSAVMEDMPRSAMPVIERYLAGKYETSIFISVLGQELRNAELRPQSGEAESPFEQPRAESTCPSEQDYTERRDLREERKRYAAARVEESGRVPPLQTILRFRGKAARARSMGRPGEGAILDGEANRLSAIRDARLKESMLR